MLIHSMDCDEGPGAHLVCPKGEPNGTWVDSWKALESLVEKGKNFIITIIIIIIVIIMIVVIVVVVIIVVVVVVVIFIIRMR